MKDPIEKSRTSSETEIQVLLYSGKEGEIETRIGLLSHLLTLFSFHGGFGLQLQAQGDLHVDTHHLMEDCGIVLGWAFLQLEKKGIQRFASLVQPMDESLIQVVVDISGRPYLNWSVTLHRERIGDLEVETVREFWQAFVNQARITLHIQQLQGQNEHHILEAVFKGVGRALQIAYQQKQDHLPSTKGIMD